MTSATRSEKDPLGPLDVPADAYYGVQTLRAVQNFPISGLRPLREFVRAVVWIKKAAAMTHRETGRLDGTLADAIVAAADEVLAGKYRRPLRRGRVPGGRRHIAQHERQRGAGQPRQRTARREARRVQAGAPERPRQHGPVHQRRDPDGDPPGGARSPGRARRRVRRPARRVRREGTGVRRYREGRAHPPAGRDAHPAGPGVRGLRGTPSIATSRASARRRISSAIWASAAPPSARGSTSSRSIRR